MKELTNEVWRTKRKLKLMEEDGFAQLIMDILLKVRESDHIPIDIDVVTNILIKDLKKQYLKILEEYKPSEQQKLDF